MRRQRGQAVTELALMAPLFAGMIVVLGLWARLTLTRLALIHLTRDAAILLAHDADHWGAGPAEQQDQVRQLAKQYPLLDPQQLDLAVEGLPLPGGLDLGGGSFAKLFLGCKLRLRYRLRLQGLAARAFPNGLELEEWGAVQGDPWLNPTKSLFHALIGG